MRRHLGTVDTGLTAKGSREGGTGANPPGEGRAFFPSGEGDGVFAVFAGGLPPLASGAAPDAPGFATRLSADHAARRAASGGLCLWALCFERARCGVIGGVTVAPRAPCFGGAAAGGVRAAATAEKEYFAMEEEEAELRREVSSERRRSSIGPRSRPPRFRVDGGGLMPHSWLLAARMSFSIATMSSSPGMRPAPLLLRRRLPPAAAAPACHSPLRTPCPSETEASSGLNETGLKAAGLGEGERPVASSAASRVSCRDRAADARAAGKEPSGVAARLLVPGSAFFSSASVDGDRCACHARGTREPADEGVAPREDAATRGEPDARSRDTPEDAEDAERRAAVAACRCLLAFVLPKAPAGAAGGVARPPGGGRVATGASAGGAGRFSWLRSAYGGEGGSSGASADLTREGCRSSAASRQLRTTGGCEKCEGGREGDAGSGGSCRLPVFSRRTNPVFSCPVFSLLTDPPVFSWGIPA